MISMKVSKHKDNSFANIDRISNIRIQKLSYGLYIRSHKDCDGKILKFQEFIERNKIENSIRDEDRVRVLELFTHNK